MVLMMCKSIFYKGDYRYVDEISRYVHDLAIHRLIKEIVCDSQIEQTKEESSQRIAVINLN